MNELEEQPALEDMCVCLHDFGAHSSKGKHRCLECHCRGYRHRSKHAGRQEPQNTANGPDAVFVDGPNGEAVQVPVQPERGAMKLVVVESPFKGDREKNKAYLERCLRDCIDRGESPYASHKMLADCLNDDDPEERLRGINAGFAWKRVAQLTAFYVDLGWSGGMKLALEICRLNNLPHEIRTLGTP